MSSLPEQLVCALPKGGGRFEQALFFNENQCKGTELGHTLQTQALKELGAY